MNREHLLHESDISIVLKPCAFLEGRFLMRDADVLTADIDQCKNIRPGNFRERRIPRRNKQTQPSQPVDTASKRLGFGAHSYSHFRHLHNVGAKMRTSPPWLQPRNLQLTRQLRLQLGLKRRD